MPCVQGIIQVRALDFAGNILLLCGVLALARMACNDVSPSAQCT